MRAKFINEKFQEKSDPIKDMGIGAHLIYDITDDENDPENFNFKFEIDAVVALIKKYIKGISDNEINRFWAFQLQDIINEIPTKYFENKDYAELDKYIERGIQSWERSWMGMHSDKAMRSMMR